MRKILRLGTRGSPLALLQAEEVKKKIVTEYDKISKNLEIEVVPIRTTGDWQPDQKELSFRDIGGTKEFFTKEIDEALIQHHIDIAVHSMKDVAGQLPSRIEMAAVLPRIDPRDAFISQKAQRLEDLSPGSVVGTSSLRRQAQILAVRPDLKVIPFRGNVETRLQKLAEGKADATLLALAGLMRLGLQHLASSVLNLDVMLPAAAQGALGIAIRQNDEEMRQLLTPVNSNETWFCVNAERALLKALDGSCRTPIGSFAYYTAPGQIALEAVAARADGSQLLRMKSEGKESEAEMIGTHLGVRMREQLPADFFDY